MVIEPPYAEKGFIVPKLKKEKSAKGCPFLSTSLKLSASSSKIIKLFYFAHSKISVGSYLDPNK